jgi:sugar lactone lactonase YvrE
MTRLASDTRQPVAAFALSVLSLSLVACGGDPAPEPARDPNTPVAVVDRGLATPESVLWDATRELWYVSNINGVPVEKDGNGYILRLTADGAMMDSLPFINGADDDITLHAPKGMALVGDTLWVADIDHVRGFNVVTGTEVASIDLQGMGATFLNDVAAGTDGTVYITDSGIAFDTTGAVLHPGASRVFALLGRSAREAVVLPRESAANGIAWDPSRGAWLIVGFNSPNVFAWTPGAASAEVVGSGPGGGDGLVILADGRALYSSWADSSLTVFENGTSTTLRKGLPSPADLGYDPARGLVAVPLFASDRIELWDVR